MSPEPEATFKKVSGPTPEIIVGELPVGGNAGTTELALATDLSSRSNSALLMRAAADLPGGFPGAVEIDLQAQVGGGKDGSAADTTKAPTATGKPPEGVCWQTEDGGTQYWEKGGLKTVWPDNTVRVEYPDGRGFVVSSDGSGKHWGPTPSDNYETTADGGIERINWETLRTVTTWPDGTVREVSMLGDDDKGFVVKPDGSRHVWGPTPNDNYDETPTPDGGIKRTYADGGWFTKYPDGRMVEPLKDGQGTREWIPGGPNNYTIRIHSGNRIRDTIGSGDPTLADSPPHMRRASWADWENTAVVLNQ